VLGLRGRATHGGSLFDPFLYLYSGFDPNNPCDNLAAMDDDDGCGRDSLISLPDLAAGTYTVVASSFYPTSDPFDEPTGSYTLETAAPPDCPAGAAAQGRAKR
jgi:hypothetical protein